MGARPFPRGGRFWYFSNSFGHLGHQNTPNFTGNPMGRVPRTETAQNCPNIKNLVYSPPAGGALTRAAERSSQKSRISPAAIQADPPPGKNFEPKFLIFGLFWAVSGLGTLPIGFPVKFGVFWCHRCPKWLQKCRNMTFLGSLAKRSRERQSEKSGSGSWGKSASRVDRGGWGACAPPSLEKIVRTVRGLSQKLLNLSFPEYQNSIFL